MSIWRPYPRSHPLRKIRRVVNEALVSLDAEVDALHIDFGRPSIPPEQLIRASLLQIFYSVRFERQLMEQMNCNLLFCLLVGRGVDDPVGVLTVFTKNRDRLLTTEMSRKVNRSGLIVQGDLTQANGRTERSGA